MRIMQHNDAERVSETTDPSRVWIATMDLRSKVGGILFGLANRVYPSGERIDLEEEFDAGYRVGFRRGNRQGLDMLRLAFDAGQAKGAEAASC